MTHALEPIIRAVLERVIVIARSHDYSLQSTSWADARAQAITADLHNLDPAALAAELAPLLWRDVATDPHLRVTGPNSDGEYSLHIQTGNRSGGINLGTDHSPFVGRLLDEVAEKPTETGNG